MIVLTDRGRLDRGQVKPTNEKDDQIKKKYKASLRRKKEKVTRKAIGIFWMRTFKNSQ